MRNSEGVEGEVVEQRSGNRGGWRTRAGTFVVTAFVVGACGTGQPETEGIDDWAEFLRSRQSVEDLAKRLGTIAERDSTDVPPWEEFLDNVESLEPEGSESEPAVGQEVLGQDGCWYVHRGGGQWAPSQNIDICIRWTEENQAGHLYYRDQPNQLVVWVDWRDTDYIIMETDDMRVRGARHGGPLEILSNGQWVTVEQFQAQSVSEDVVNSMLFTTTYGKLMTGMTNVEKLMNARSYADTRDRLSPNYTGIDGP